MGQSVFLSYARASARREALALAKELKGLAFLDTEGIEPAELFPQRLLNALLDSSLIVVFADGDYANSWYCGIELRVALATSHGFRNRVIVAMGDRASEVLDGLPPEIANSNWLKASETTAIAALVRDTLPGITTTFRSGLNNADAEKLLDAIIEETRIPPPLDFGQMTISLPVGRLSQSIGPRFVGRAEDLRRLHRLIADGRRGNAARMTGRISAGGGFGKTRLAIEYLHRYGPKYFPGGLFWVTANASDLNGEFCRVLEAIAPAGNRKSHLRKAPGRVREELRAALTRIKEPALFVVDNIPESTPGEEPQDLSFYCPAIGSVNVLATSRQDTQEDGVVSLTVDTLPRTSAMLLLTNNVRAAAEFGARGWGRIAEFVGDLPIALDLLNRCLVLGAITPEALLHRLQSAEPVELLDQFRAALLGQVPANAVRGITETFAISFESLDEQGRSAARSLARLAPGPIPEELMESLPGAVNNPTVRAALRSRHFVVGAESQVFGSIHPLVNAYLRSLPASASDMLDTAIIDSVWRLFSLSACLDPTKWPVLDLCARHVRVLLERAAVNRVVASRSLGELGAFVGVLRLEQGRTAEARTHNEWLLKIYREDLKTDNDSVITVLGNLANVMDALGDYDRGRALRIEAQEMSPNSHHAYILRAALAGNALQRGHPEEALNLLYNLPHIKDLEDVGFGDGVHERVATRGAFVLALHQTGESERAIAIARKQVALYEGKNGPLELNWKNNLASMLPGGDPEALALMSSVAKLCEVTFGAEHPHTLKAKDNLVVRLYESGERSQAVDLATEVVAAMIRTFGDTHPDTEIAKRNLSLMLQESPLRYILAAIQKTIAKIY